MNLTGSNIDTKSCLVIGKDMSHYNAPLNFIQLATYLEYFIANSKRDMNKIYELLGLDKRNRIKNSNSIEYAAEDSEQLSLLSINKGLTMELFASSIFSGIDHPHLVHAHCKTATVEFNGGETILPNNYAQGGVPDVEIDYGEFILLLEVSAKVHPSLTHFEKQLKGAIKHARDIRKKEQEKPIYCLLINERSLSQTEIKIRAREIYSDVTNEENIYVTALSIEEFSILCKDLAYKYEKRLRYLTTEDIQEALVDTVKKGADELFDEMLIKKIQSYDDKGKIKVNLI